MKILSRTYAQYTIVNLQMKFERNQIKTVVVVGTTNFSSKSASFL